MQPEATLNGPAGTGDPEHPPPTAEVNAELTALVREQMSYASVLDLRIVEMTKERTVGLGEWTPERTTTGGVLHGGYLMGCADAVGAIVAYLNLPAGSIGTTTIESKTNFMRGVRSGTVLVDAVPVHIGRTTIVVQTDIVDDRGRLVSRTTQTQLAVQPSQGNGETS